MADVTIKINDREVTVPEGTLVVDAAKAAGIEIPVFCSHPKLDPLGACRMCLVEIGGPRGARLMTACTTPVGPDMTVRTDIPAVVEAQKGVLEFILTNHPLDCPICDKGGECPLQNNTLHYGPGTSQFEERKTLKEKRYPISPLIMLDQERCILCWRCTRYLEEWSDDPQLGLFERGGQTVIDHFPGQPVDAKTSGNIIDLCPVGALTNRVARFRFRPWEIQRTASVCTHCAVGCNIRVDTRTQEVRRIVARENMAVNDEWICDKGRFVHGYVDSPARLTKPLVRKDGQLQEATWDEALAAVVKGFGDIITAKGADAIGGIGSAKVTNEAAYLFQKFLRATIGTNNVDHRHGSSVAAYPAGLPAIPDIPKAAVIFLCGADPSEEAPVLELFIKRAVRRKGAKLVIAHPRHIELTRYNGPYMACTPGTEAALLNGLAHIILSDGLAAETAKDAAGFGDLAAALAPFTPDATAAATGVDVETLRLAAATLAGAKSALFLYGLAAVQGPGGAAALFALNNLALLTGQAGRLVYLGLDANAHGARAAGLLPNMLPGFLPVGDAAARLRLQGVWGGTLPDKPGLSYHAMTRGQVSGLYVMGADPAGDDPAAKAALSALSFLVVQDLFLSETAKLAHVVLPAVSFAEQDGTYTNVEGRVQRIRQALRPKGQAVADWAIIAHLGQRWAAPESNGSQRGERVHWQYGTLEAVFAEMAGALPLFAGLSWAALGEAGQRWDTRSAPQPPAAFQPVDAPVLSHTEGYPFRLLVGALLYDKGTLTAMSHPPFHQVVPPPFVLLHPADAQTAQLADGDMALLRSAHGELRVPVKVADAVRPGTLWLPESMEGTPAGALLNGGGPVVAVQVQKA